MLNEIILEGTLFQLICSLPGNRTRQEVVRSMNVWRFGILSHKWAMKQENTTRELKMDHFMGLHRASCWGPRVSCNSCARLKFKRLSRNPAAEPWIETKGNFLAIQSSLKQPVHPHRCAHVEGLSDFLSCYKLLLSPWCPCTKFRGLSVQRGTHIEKHTSNSKQQERPSKHPCPIVFLNFKFVPVSFPIAFSLDWLIGQDKRQEGEAWFRTVGLLKLGPGRRDDALWRKVQGTVGGKKGVCL